MENLNLKMLEKFKKDLSIRPGNEILKRKIKELEDIISDETR